MSRALSHLLEADQFFGGVVAAALKTIELLERDLVANRAEAGAYLRQALRTKDEGSEMNKETARRMMSGLLLSRRLHFCFSFDLTPAGRLQFAPSSMFAGCQRFV